MRILAALLIIISLILLLFGFLSLEAHTPPEEQSTAPFMIAAGLFWLIMGIVIAVRTVRTGVFYSVVHCWVLEADVSCRPSGVLD
jgi:hypothetical protein